MTVTLAKLRHDLDRVIELGVSPTDPRIAPLAAYLADTARPAKDIYVHELDEWFSSPKDAARRLGAELKALRRALNDRYPFASLYLPKQGFCVHLSYAGDRCDHDVAYRTEQATTIDRIPNVWATDCQWHVTLDAGVATIDRGFNGNGPNGFDIVLHPSVVTDRAVCAPKQRLVFASSETARAFLNEPQLIPIERIR